MLNYRLSTEEVNTVLAGLAELPYKVSTPIIKNLQEQYAAQQAPQSAVQQELPLEN
jgi:16S rRNA A1518/A1519 N6-dimethyltransferase RsmA/KsgA/DIM1 with predicted DNA glycosylase/AP lyase activity